MNYSPGHSLLGVHTLRVPAALSPRVPIGCELEYKSLWGWIMYSKNILNIYFELILEEK